MRALARTVKVLRRTFDVLNNVETYGVLLLATLLGTALAGALVFGVPATVAWTLFTRGQFAAAGVVVVLMVLATVGIVRDLRSRRLSWLSAVLAALWVLGIVYVGARLVLAW